MVVVVVVVVGKMGRFYKHESGGMNVAARRVPDG